MAYTPPLPTLTDPDYTAPDQRKYRYPWGLLRDGQRHVLSPSEQLRASPERAKQRIYQWASENRYHATIDTHGYTWDPACVIAVVLRKR